MNKYDNIDRNKVYKQMIIGLINIINKMKIIIWIKMYKYF